MTMIRFTYDDGASVTTVTWTPEYGFMAAGDHEILSRISYEEVQPRSNTGIIGMTTTTPPLPIIGIDVGIDACDACGCTESEHGRDGCEKHDCKTFIP